MPGDPARRRPSTHGRPTVAGTKSPREDGWPWRSAAEDDPTWVDEKMLRWSSWSRSGWNERSSRSSLKSFIGVRPTYANPRSRLGDSSAREQRCFLPSGVACDTGGFLTGA